MSNQWKIVGAALGEGAQIIGTKLGPDYCQNQQLVKTLEKNGFFLSWLCTMLTKPEKKPALEIVQDFCERLAQKTAALIKQGDHPLVIGGDHSVAIGTWSGVITALKAEQNFGLIWIDAHMDAHTFETTPSKAIHGMPVATLLGHGDLNLTRLLSSQPKISPKHLVLIGVRSYEPGEAKLLRDNAVKIFYMDDIKARGFDSIWQEALTYIQSQVPYFGISIDLDGFDPSIAPGVGSPEVDGLMPAEVFKSIQGIALNPKCQCVEIVEFNPERDKNNATYRLILQLIQTLFLKNM